MADLKSKLESNGINITNIVDNKDGIVINCSSKYSDIDANLNILYKVLPDGRYNDKDVMLQLNEDDSIESYEQFDLFESTPHPSLIAEGDRITIDHKSFGTISVVVKKIKRWDRNNDLDGAYYVSKQKGIMGFVSFDNIIRYYKN